MPLGLAWKTRLERNLQWFSLNRQEFTENHLHKPSWNIRNTRLLYTIKKLFRPFLELGSGFRRFLVHEKQEIHLEP